MIPKSFEMKWLNDKDKRAGRNFAREHRNFAGQETNTPT
jgi:hypothetical protein